MRLRSALFLVFAFFGLSGCTVLGIPAVGKSPKGPPATPEVLGAFAEDAVVATPSDWRERRAPLLKDAFQKFVYGYFPDLDSTRVTDRRVVDGAAYEDAATLEEWSLAVPTARGERLAHLALVTPKNASGPLPAIVLQTFCGNRAATQREDIAPPVGREDMCAGGGLMGAIIGSVFGEYISSPPIEEILARGYALAFIYPGDFVPDQEEAGLAALASFAPSVAQDSREPTRWGAVAAWAWAFSEVNKHLEADPRFDPERIAIFGHSRHGKAALVAAAYDENIDLVLSHQSGFGGASLSRSNSGEGLKRITESYPHWFSAAYAGYAERKPELPVDQHQLIALIAPRPVLLGNARRDKWSDPASSFRAAEGADAAYELLGSQGLDQDNLRDVNLEADLAFFMRGGRHGIVAKDWENFLGFLDAHFQ